MPPVYSAAQIVTKLRTSPQARLRLVTIPSATTQLVTALCEPHSAASRRAEIGTRRVGFDHAAAIFAQMASMDTRAVFVLDQRREVLAGRVPAIRTKSHCVRNVTSDRTTPQIGFCDGATDRQRFALDIPGAGLLFSGLGLISISDPDQIGSIGAV